MAKDLTKLLRSLTQKGFHVQLTRPNPRRGNNLWITFPAPFNYRDFYFYDVRRKDVEQILSIIDLLTQS